jgi:hypothetical protein
VDRLLAHHRPERYSPAARASTDPTFFMARAYRRPGPDALESAWQRVREDLAAGRPRFSLVALCANLGADLDALYNAADTPLLATLRASDGRLGLLDGLAHLFLPVNARWRQTPRFVELCRRLGLVDYWNVTGRWPDCAIEVAPRYDFIATCRDPRA